MNSIKITAIICFLFFSLTPCLFSEGENAKTKYAVLGFQSGLFNDVQDRMLREEILREMKRSGMPVVTVMELEALVQEQPKMNLRKLKQKDVAGLIESLGAGYALYGTVSPAGGNTKAKAGQADKLRIELSIFVSEKNAAETFAFDLKGEKNFYDFTKSASVKIVSEVRSRLEQNK